MTRQNKGLVAIFDVDETLIQSGLKLRNDVAQALGRFGVQLTPDDVKGDWYALAASYGIGKEDFDIELNKRKSWEQALRDGDAPLFSDTYSCLNALMEKGVQVGILTRSDPAYTQAKIVHFGLEKYIGDRIAVTPVDRKQFPTKEQEALGLMRKIGPETVRQAYFIGDNPEDVTVAPMVAKELDISAQGLYLSRYGKPIPEEVKNYRTITSLEEIPAILGEEHGR